MGLRCGVYWNNNKRLFSLRNEDVSTRETTDRHYGRVIAHAQRVWMGPSTFHVSEAGRERANDEGRKNVHARVLGEVAAISGLWNFPLLPDASDGVADTAIWEMVAYGIEVVQPQADGRYAGFIGPREYVDEKYLDGIWNQSHTEGTLTAHYSPWAGPAHFTAFSNGNVCAVGSAEAVELSCMVEGTDEWETLRRPSVYIPSKGSVLGEVMEADEVTEIL